MTSDTEAAREAEVRLALADRMDEEAAEIDDPMCSYFDAVALLREGAAALRSIPAAAALLRDAGWRVEEPRPAIVCERCLGSGGVPSPIWPGARAICPTCNGTGKRP